MFKDRPAIDNFGYMLECLSSYNAFNKKEDGYWNANNNEERQIGEQCLTDSISKMLLMFKGNCPMIRSISADGKVNTKGNGHKRPKFHAHLHLAEWISNYASPANFNTQRFESNHKVIVKNVSMNVQKRGSGKFLSQIAVRGYERQVLATCMEKFNITSIESKSKRMDHENTEVRSNMLSWKSNRSTNFYLIISSKGSIKQVWKQKSTVLLHLEISPIVCKFVSKEFTNLKSTVTLGCVSELVLTNLKVIWCHPNYQGEGEWGGWVLHTCPNSRKQVKGSF